MNRGIVIVIVVVVVAAIIGVVYIFLGQSNDGGDDNQDVAYHTGD